MPFNVGMMIRVQANNGKKIWDKQIGAGFTFTSPSVDPDGEMIYIGSDDHYLYAINLEGEVVWRFKTEGPITSTPLVGANGVVYIASQDGQVYALYTK
jgi:outer membrane protein assembly factor BamB